MSQPDRFSWIEKPLLAAMARPDAREQLTWLRRQGIEILISLTQQPPPRDWINDAGLMLVHVPVEDMHPPTQPQLDHCISVIRRAQEQNRGVAIHCGAGLGRTGTIVAAWLVEKGLSADNAIARVRRLRPGSIETDEQEEAIAEFARRRASPEPRA